MQIRKTMKHEFDDIEFALTLLSDGEKPDKASVEEWLRDAEHVELLKTIALLREAYSPADFSRLKQSEKARLMRKIRKMPRRRIYWFAAAASVLLILSVSLYLLTALGTSRTGDRTLAYHAPARQQAELILSTGETITLGAGALQVGNEAETGIVKDSLQKLSYRYAQVKGEEAAEIFNTLVIPVDGLYELELSDGTRVWLNSVSQLRYPVQFAGNERKVYLSGEAYFDVKRDTTRPFIVSSDGMDVRVYGTEFNVTAYEGEPLRTVLVNGKVGMQARNSGEILLQPGEMGKYNAEAQKIEVQAVNTRLYTAWKDGTFAFNNETIEQIMGRLSRWYDLNVFYANEEVKSQVFDGIIPQVNNVEDILRLIEGTATVRFELKGNTVVVK